MLLRLKDGKIDSIFLFNKGTIVNEVCNFFKRGVTNNYIYNPLNIRKNLDFL